MRKKTKFSLRRSTDKDISHFNKLFAAQLNDSKLVLNANATRVMRLSIEFKFEALERQMFAKSALSGCDVFFVAVFVGEGKRSLKQLVSIGHVRQTTVAICDS